MQALNQLPPPQREALLLHFLEDFSLEEIAGVAGVSVGIGQFAPRVGIAYRATEKTVIRLGYGISVDPNSFRAMRDAYPATISLARSRGTCRPRRPMSTTSSTS